MHGIRVRWFYGKRSANAREDSGSDRDNVAMAFEGMERLYGGKLLVRIQTSAGASANNGAGGLGECKSGSYLASLDTQRSTCRDVLF